MAGFTADLHARYPGVAFGDGVQVIGMDHVSIGRGTCVGDDAWLNVCSRHGGIRMVIGRNCFIGRRSIFNTAGRLELGDYCLLAAGVYIADADHVFADITRPYVEQGVIQGRNVTVEENCWLGIGSVITGGLTMGRGCVVAAGAVVLEDMAPFTVVAGVPARPVKMYDPMTGAWERCATPGEMDRILEHRQRSPLPGREEYAAMLRANSNLDGYDPVLTGQGRCL